MSQMNALNPSRGYYGGWVTGDLVGLIKGKGEAGIDDWTLVVFIRPL